MNQQEADEIERRLAAFQEANSKVFRIEKILSVLQAFKDDQEHDIGLIAINPNTDEMSYLNQENARELRTAKICSLSGDENRKFCESFFVWAEQYFLERKNEAESEASNA
jgi:hypothetical protein